MTLLGGALVSWNRGNTLQVGLAVQATSLAGMFMVNAIMLSTYLKALQTSGSTVAAVTSCAVNFLLSVSDNLLSCIHRSYSPSVVFHLQIHAVNC